MGASSENFCLRWNDFESNVSGAFRQLRAESDFFDVTLACSDSGGRSLQAHKVILSACSSFFKQMLRQQASHQNHPNPYIYLRGVTFCDLSSVLDFMYHGEVNVAQEDLNSFLAVAEELQIKGLTNKDEASKKPVRLKPDSAGGGNSGGPPQKRQRRSSPGPSASNSSQKESGEEDVKTVVDIKSDPEAGPSGSGQQAVTDFGDDDAGDFGDENFGDSYYDDNGDGTGDMLEADASAEGGEDSAGGKDFEAFADVKQFIKRSLDDASGARRWSCGLCGKITSDKSNARRHMVVKHVKPSSLPCEFCGKPFKNKYHLNQHIRNGVCLRDVLLEQKQE